MGKVSIIIPFYNEEFALPRCLDSVLAQSYRNLEIILVDGASTDGSPAICSEYGSRDARIRVIRQPRKNGISGGRNDGLAVATGEYIQFVDADDRIPPDMTAALVEAISGTECELAATGFKFVQEQADGSLEWSIIPSIHGIVPVEDYVAYCTTNVKEWPTMLGSVWCKLFRLESLRREGVLFEHDLMGEDFLFSIRYLRSCRRVSVIQSPCYEYIYPAPGAAYSEITNVNRYESGRTRALLRMGKDFEDAFSGRLPAEALRWCRNSLANLAIASMVNICRSDATIPDAEIRTMLLEVASSPIIAEWMRCYRPAPGQSRAVPFLLRYRLVWLLLYLCRYKAAKRYGAYYKSRV